MMRKLNLLTVLLLGTLAAPAAAADPAPPYGDLARLAPWVQTTGRTQRFPATLLRDYGIETDQPAEVRRVIARSQDGRTRYMILLVPIAGQERPHIVIVRMSFNESDQLTESVNYRVNATGALVASSRRPAGGALQTIPLADAAKPFAAQVTFWHEFQEAENRRVAENSNPPK